MKIALIGAAPSSLDLGPYHDLSWEIWACSPGNYKLPRVDAWFEMHSLDRKMVSGNEPYFEALIKHQRVYVSKKDSRLPHAIEYPKEQILSRYNPLHHGFFSSSVSWMFALAIEQKPEAIGMWGIDMAANDEYAYQRPGCHFFMGIADTQGIKLVLPPQSDIAQVHPLYGYKEHWPMYWKQRARKKEIQSRIAGIDNKMNGMTQERAMLMGALQDVEYVDGTWLKP